MKVSTKKLKAIFFLLPLFIKFLRIETGFFDFYIFDSIILISLPYFFINSSIISRKFLSIIILLSVVCSIQILVNPDIFLGVIKQLLNIGLYYTYIYMLIRYYKHDIRYLFFTYIQITLFTAFIGAFQLLGYIIKIQPLYDFRWILPAPWKLMTDHGFIRVNSIYNEPSFFGVALSPLIFIAVNNLLTGRSIYFSKKISIFVLLMAVSTASSLAFIGIIVSLTLVKFKTPIIRKTKFIIVGPVAILVLFILYFQVPVFEERVNAMIFGLTNMNQSNLERINLSAFALINNLYIALLNFESNPIIGGGFGSHAILYSQKAFTHVSEVSANFEGGASMLIRIISETGILGLIVLAFYLIRFWRWSNDISKMSIINRAAFVYITLILLRVSVFGYQALPLMFYLYMYSGKSK